MQTTASGAMEEVLLCGDRAGGGVRRDEVGKGGNDERHSLAPG